jgi:hypothetical protein
MLENNQEKVEDKIIDYINFSSGARLVVFKPEDKKNGINLSVERRGNYKEAPFNFRVNVFFGPPEPEKFIKDFTKSDLMAGRNFYLIFVYFDEVKQKINDYVWVIPSLQFEEIAKVVVLENGDKVYRFEASSNLRDKNTYSRFLADAKQLGKLIFDAFVAGGKINFKATIFDEGTAVNLDRLSEFIIEARKNTFAGDVTAIDNPRLLSSVQLEFIKGDYYYRDIYFTGNKKTIGQEMVYENSKPIWVMNYIGNPIGKLEINFLKESLYKLSEKCRFGKDCQYQKREYKYQDIGSGDLKEFSGEENIFVDEKNIYTCKYQGCLIADKL